MCSARAVRVQCVCSACALQISRVLAVEPVEPVAGWVRAECAPKGGGVGRSVLHHAAWAGDLSIFQRLVEAGADVMRQRNTAWRPNGGVRGRGATPLHHAVMYNRKKIVDFMLNTLGVPVDLPGEQGCTGVVNVPSWQRRSLLPRPPGTRGLGAWASGLGCSTPPEQRPSGRDLSGSVRWHLQPAPRSPRVALLDVQVHAAPSRGQVQLPRDGGARPCSSTACNPIYQRLQPHVPEDATLCTQVEFLLRHGARTDMLTRDEKTARHLEPRVELLPHEELQPHAQPAAP